MWLALRTPRCVCVCIDFLSPVFYVRFLCEMRYASFASESKSQCACACVCPVNRARATRGTFNPRSICRRRRRPRPCAGCNNVRSDSHPHGRPRGGSDNSTRRAGLASWAVYFPATRSGGDSPLPPTRKTFILITAKMRSLFAPGSLTTTTTPTTTT